MKGMEETVLAARLAEIDSRSRSNTHRLDKLEGNVAAIQSLATSVAVMAEKQGSMADQVGKIASDVEDLKGEPGRRWKNITEKIITVAVTAAVTYLLARIGLG